MTGHRIGFNLTGSTGFLDIYDCYITTPLSSGLERGFALGNSGDYCLLRSNFVFCGGIGIELTSSGSNNIFHANYLGGTGITSFQFNATYSGQRNAIAHNIFLNTFVFGGATSPALTKFSDNQGIEGLSIDVTSGGSVTPDRSKGPVLRVRGTTTGAAYTINAPTPTPTSLDRNIYLTLILFNNAGGAVTGWNFNAIYHISAAAAVTDTNRTTYVLHWDPDSSIWVEVSRSATT
jgi:hypothetical protein